MSITWYTGERCLPVLLLHPASHKVAQVVLPASLLSESVVASSERMGETYKNHVQSVHTGLTRGVIDRRALLAAVVLLKLGLSAFEASCTSREC
jgi:hypothetical protein